MGKARGPVSVVSVVLLLAGLLVGGVARESSSSFAAAAEPGAGESVSYSGGDLQPVTPARVLDTRSGIGAPAQRLGAGDVISVKVTGVAGVPNAGVDSVVLNLTGISPVGNTYLTVWPHGEQRPLASSLNLDAGEVRPNLVTVKVGRDGLVDIYNYNGEVNLAADVSGWFPVASGLRSVTPARILDTRTGLGAPKAPLGSGRSIELQVTGRGGVPSDGVSAVVVNLTGVSPTAGSTYLTAWPAGFSRPVASNLNLNRGDVAANLAVAKVGSGGKIGLYNYSGNVNVVADVVGWFSSDSAYEALTPSRILDTRKGIGAAAKPVGESSTIGLKVTGVGGVPANGVGAVVLNLTGISPTGSSTYVTAWPNGVTRPVASNLNLTRGAVVPNLVVVKVGSGGVVNLFNYSRSIHLAADVVGWFPTGTESSTSMTPKPDTVLVGPGDITAITPTADDGTGGVATLAASADVPDVGGQFAYVGGPGGDTGASGEVTSVVTNPDGTATVNFSDANLQDLFDDLEIHIDDSDSHSAEQDLLRGGLAARATDGGSSADAPLKAGATDTDEDDGACSVGGAPVPLAALTFGAFHGSADYSLVHRSAKIEMGGTLTMGWAGAFTGSVSCEVALGEGPIGWIGPVEIGWEVGAGISISAAVTASATVNVPISIGFDYDDGDATNLSHADINGSADGNAEAVLSAEFSAGLSTKLFGIVGVKAALSPGLDLTLTDQGDSASPCVMLDAKVGLGIGAEVEKWGVGWSFTIADTTLADGNIYTSPNCQDMRWEGTITINDLYESVCTAGDDCPAVRNWSNQFQGDLDLIGATNDGFGTESYLSHMDVTSVYKQHDQLGGLDCTQTTDTLSTTTYPGVDRVGVIMKKSGDSWLILGESFGLDPVDWVGESGEATVDGTVHVQGCGTDETNPSDLTFARFPWLSGTIDGGGGVLLEDTDPDPNHLVGTTVRTVSDPNSGENYAGTETITLSYDLTRVPIG